MSDKKQFEKVFVGEAEKYAQSYGIQALSDRPNKSLAYGEGGLKPQDLKIRFDALATELIKAVSEIQTALTGGEGTKYIGVSATESLYQVLEGLGNGEFAKRIKVDSESDTSVLAAIEANTNSIAQNKLNSVNVSKDNDGISILQFEFANSDNDKAVPIGNIVSTTAVEAAITGFDDTEKTAVKEKLGIDDLSIAAEIDETNYHLTVKLKGSDGNEKSSSTIDLPLESMVVSAEYDNANKQIILTLKSGEEISFGVSDLVSGLVNTETLEAEISNLEGKLLKEEDVIDIVNNNFPPAEGVDF